MSITEHLNKIKPWVLPINIILIGTLGFGLGRLSRIEEVKMPVLIEKPTIPVASTTLSFFQTTRGDQVVKNPNLATSTTLKNSGMLVGSKNGTKYYYPTCFGVARIKEENKVWFNSIDEAKKAGYTKASNCAGL